MASTLTPISKPQTQTALSMRGQSSVGVGPKVVVVQSGARDAYQLALALSEAGLLEALVTDLFWPADRNWAKAISKLLPRGVAAMLDRRSESRIPSSRVRQCFASGLAALAAEKIRRLPLSIRRGTTRRADTILGRTAGELATRRNAGLVSYSYYGFEAFSHYPRPGMLFQLHPHPLSMRRILTQELESHPECAASLQQEWELALPEEDFQHLVQETRMASRFLVASTFTKQTLIEHGTPDSAIRVVPYGVDTTRFFPAPHRKDPSDTRLHLLFVGRINQRKGIKYLLEALRLLDTHAVHLTICGRVVDGLELFRSFGSRINLRPSVSAEELVSAYQSADLFVFPSVAEGFGQVLLEALASGLPVLSTTHTAAPDLIDHGVQGFIVEPRSAEALATHIEWALTHRAQLSAMRESARRRSLDFTWERFRGDVVHAVSGFLQEQPREDSLEEAHV